MLDALPGTPLPCYGMLTFAAKEKKNHHPSIPEAMSDFPNASTIPSEAVATCTGCFQAPIPLPMQYAPESWFIRP